MHKYEKHVTYIDDVRFVYVPYCS